MNLHQPLTMCAGSRYLAVDAAGFDGTDVMRRGSAFTGAADSKTGILSVWLSVPASVGFPYALQFGSEAIGSAVPRGVSLAWLAVTNGHLIIEGVDSVPAYCLRVQTNTSLAAGVWYHYLASWDLAALTVNVYLNDALDRWGSSEIVIDSALDYTNGDNSAGGTGAAASWPGALAEIYFAPGQYLDFSLPYNRRKFISADGKPVYLGTDGSAPTGVAPIAYFHLDDGEAPANFAVNRGTGGSMTITGTLTTYGTSPSG